MLRAKNTIAPHECQMKKKQRKHPAPGVERAVIEVFELLRVTALGEQATS